MLAKIHSATTVGLDARLIDVEVDIQPGLFKFNIVGLPDKAIQESKERVFSAIKNSNADFLYQHITVNLAPGNVPKAGPSFELPIALGILLASGQVDIDVRDSIFLGELSLEGSVRPIEGVLVIVDWARKNGFKKIYLPIENAIEASLIEGISVFPVKNLNEIIEKGPQIEMFVRDEKEKIESDEVTNYEIGFEDIKGQPFAKRALEIACAGLHNIIFSGTPGSGKTMLARAIPTILPTLSFDESIELTRIYSVAGLVSSRNPLYNSRPFRSPHHTSSDVALVGGGRIPRPGEISLAHNGVLFLDEFPEFSRRALEALRQPIEEGIITISRANGVLKFPANFMLVAAMNPCKCGWRGDTKKRCTCSELDFNNYQRKVSGPILDRIDLQVFVPRVEREKLVELQAESESSSIVKQRVSQAHLIQKERFSGMNFSYNSAIPQKYLEKLVVVSPSAREYLTQMLKNIDISARSYFRLLKVARTIADLGGADIIQDEHIAEAMGYRMLSGG